MSNVLILTKEEPLNLTKNTPLATKLQVGAGWDFKAGLKIDLDLLAYTDTKKIAYFGVKDPLNGAIVASPDNRDGKGQGIDEFIEVDLDKVPADVNKITFAVSSHSGEDFGTVQGEFVQIKDVATGTIIAKSTELPTTLENENKAKTLVFGSLIRTNNEWSFETTLAYKIDNFEQYVRSVLA
jgi:tellurium resistance protein TerD